MKTTLGCIRRADQDFDMIREGDRIAVGVSGGKDSLLLLHALNLYRRFCRVPYSLVAITLTLGIEPFDTSKVAAMCGRLEIPYIVRKTQIGPILFEQRGEKNPCALCAKMRRGILNQEAIKAGCNKVALGHHRDDVLETLFLSLFYEARINTFQPVTHMDKSGIIQIRPMIYLSEMHIANTAKRLELPIIPSPCPVNGVTKRQDIKNMLYGFTRDIPDIKDRMMQALRNIQKYNLWDKSYRQGDSDEG